MDKLSYRWLSMISIIATIFFISEQSYAQVSENFVVINCQQPGTLTLSEEALIAPNLKVTGNIDARDFETLKQATIKVTRTLDLSEAVIKEYKTVVSNLGTIGDWMEGDYKPITYPANTIPSGAFSELRDNTLNKFVRGSSTLSKLILPTTLEGFMEGAFTSYSIITDLVVPKGATKLRQDGKLIYSFDGSTLLAIPPAYFGDITVAASVTSIAPGTFDAASPASITFKSPTIPTLPEDFSLSTAYIISSNPQIYSEVFKDIDCVSSLDTIYVRGLKPGTLMTTLGNMGFTRKDVRAVKIEGTLNMDDFKALINLPNIHIADLAEASVECENYSNIITLDNRALTNLQFPKFTKDLTLTIENGTFLSGHLEVPEGTFVFVNHTKRLSSITFPNSLYQIDNRSFPDYSVIESIDFSPCSNLETIEFAGETQLLTTVKLPENLKQLKYCYGPVKEINLPNSLTTLYGSDWFLERLQLPEALESFVMHSLPMVKEIDASAAKSLTSFSTLKHSPNLKTIDLSMCPILDLSGLFGGIFRGVVVSGGTRYPATTVCGIESIKLPSTIKNLNAFTSCPYLKEINLMHCFRLENIMGLNNCPSLTTLTLPESVIKITGLENCPVLTNVKSAASIPPTYYYSDDTSLDFSRISLTVPKGYAGAYHMAENWENCKEIDDNAYRVSVSQNPLQDIIDRPQFLLLYGAGIYTYGSEATLYGLPSGNFKASGWLVNGEIIPSNPCITSVNTHMEAIADYSVDPNLCEVAMKLWVPEMQTVKITIASYEHTIYVDGKKYADRTSYNPNEITYNLPLEQGEHNIAISSKLLNVSFDDKDGEQSDTNYKVTDFRVNDKNVLVQLNAGHFDMDSLDLSGNTKLSHIESNKHNHLSYINISECPNLNYLDLSDSSIEEIYYDGSPLKDIQLSRNKLHEFDLSNLRDLEYLNLMSNNIHSLDITDLDNLISLDISENDLSEFLCGNNTNLSELIICNNALPALDINMFPALYYYTVYGQKFNLTINSENFDTDLLTLSGFDLSRSSNWRAHWNTSDGGTRTYECTVVDKNVLIPYEAGRELILSYNYLISTKSNNTIEIKILLTRDNLNSTNSLKMDSALSIEGNHVIFDNFVIGEIYNLSGICIFKGYGKSPALSKGIYIIRAGENVMKISII